MKRKRFPTRQTLFKDHGNTLHLRFYTSTACYFFYSNNHCTVLYCGKVMVAVSILAIKQICDGLFCSEMRSTDEPGGWACTLLHPFLLRTRNPSVSLRDNGERMLELEE